MKTNRKTIPLLFLFAVLISASFTQENKNATTLTGAWQLQNQTGNHVLVFMDNYFSFTSYRIDAKQFIQSHGGTISTENGRANAIIEYNSLNKKQVGQKISYPFAVNEGKLIINISGTKENWTKLDNGSGPLAGVWRITERMEDGQLKPIHQTGPRKTLKILTGTRFQWAAINPETKEFSGTGGGTYTFENGKYKENIDFFSRDSSRVGASLDFEDKLENGKWHHTGLSSKGDKIYEVWGKIK